MKLQSLMLSAALIAVSTLGYAAETVGPYAGISVGSASIDADKAANFMSAALLEGGVSTAPTTVDGRSLGYKVFGGYRVSRHAAVEMYYADLGQYDLSFTTTGPSATGTGDIKVTAVGVDVLGIVPFNSEVASFIRLGAFREREKISSTINANVVSATVSGGESAVEFKAGLGLDWQVSSMVGLRAEWEYYNTLDMPTNFATLSLLMRF